MSVLRGAGVFIAVLALLITPLSASAHSDFDYSSPADGDTVGGPVDEITVAFTAPVSETGAGFEVLDSDGRIAKPQVETVDGIVFTLLLETPVEQGAVGVRYEVLAEDGHTIVGALSFTVESTRAGSTSTTTTTSPAPTTTSSNAPSTTSPPADTDASTETATPETSDPGGLDATVVLVFVAALAVAAGIVIVARRSRERQ